MGCSSMIRLLVIHCKHTWLTRHGSEWYNKSMFRISNWFNTPEKARRKALHAAEQALADKKQTKGDMAKSLLTLGGVEAFLAADGVAPRDDVLSKHPFWQRDNPMLGLDASTCLKILHHILDIHEQYMMPLRYGHPAFGYDFFDDPQDERDRIRAMKGIAWGMPEEYMKWQEQAVVLAQQEPAYAAELLDVVAMQVRFNGAGDEDNEHWPSQAEHLLANGGTLGVAEILTGLRQAVDVASLDTTLAQNPHVAQFLNNSTYDREAIAWGRQNEQNLHWLAAQHPRLSSWEIAEGINDPKSIAALADLTRDGAVLKAWYGVELKADEIATHPLAYSLYVHKHAPIYMEEAQPLPDVWSMALSLCTTGVDFKNMLLMAAKAKVSPQLRPEELSLPDLGPAP